MTGRRQIDTYARLVANTAEPASPCGCWVWTGATRKDGNRPAMSVRVPGVPSPRKVNPCRTMLEQFQHLPDEHNASHLCTETWLCVNPDHLIGEPFAINIQRRWGKHAPLPVVDRVDDDPDWLAGVACDPQEVPF